MVDLRRREFVTLLGGAAVTTVPLAARAQQAGKVPIIGFLGTDASSWSPYTAAFSQRLRAEEFTVVAGGQMQKISAGKFHFEPPFTSFDHLVGTGEPCRWDPETYALARWSPHT